LVVFGSGTIKTLLSFDNAFTNFAIGQALKPFITVANLAFPSTIIVLGSGAISFTNSLKIRCLHFTISNLRLQWFLDP
jgi:hypothetical protein